MHRDTLAQSINGSLHFGQKQRISAAEWQLHHGIVTVVMSLLLMKLLIVHIPIAKESNCTYTLRQLSSRIAQ
jgi:hypothetical protein